MAYEREDEFKGDRKKIFGKETVAGMEEVRDVANEIDSIFARIDTSELSEGMYEMAKYSFDMSDALANSLKYSQKNKEEAQRLNKAALLGVKYSTQKNGIMKLFRGFQIKMLDSQDEFTQGLQESVNSYQDVKDAAKQVYDSINASTDDLADMDAMFGGIGKSIGGFLTNPLTIASAALLQFNATQESIADEFGAIGVTEFRSELVQSNKEFTKLGYSAAESQKTVADLANSFGLAVDDSAELSENVAELAKSTGTTLEDSTKLIGLFTQTQELSGEQAENLLKSTQELALANDVAPNKVLSDVATNTEMFAKFAKDGGENILKSAVQAAKLGLELSSISKISDNLLNFQTSLNAEVEASVLIGKQLNFQKARELALAGDTAEATAEVVKQLGSAEEFNKLNAIQRQALADAAGLEVAELQKVVNKEKEALTLQGALSKQKVSDIVSEDAITGTAQLLNNLQAIAITIGEAVGPTLNMLAKAISAVVGFFGDFITLPVIAFLGLYAVKLGLATAASIQNSLVTLGLAKSKTIEAAANEKASAGKVKDTAATNANTAAEGFNLKSKIAKIPILGTLLTTTAGYALAIASGTKALIINTAITMKNIAVKGLGIAKTFALATAEMVRGAATFFAGAASGSASTLGFGTPLLVGLAVAAVAAMIAGVMKARSASKAGDMFSPAGGKTQVSTKEGGLFELSPNDDFMAAPGLAGAVSGGTGGGGTARMESQQAASNEKLDRMVSVLEGALAGPRPALARAMGSQVGDTVSGMA